MADTSELLREKIAHALSGLDTDTWAYALGEYRRMMGEPFPRPQVADRSSVADAFRQADKVVAILPGLQAEAPEDAEVDRSAALVNTDGASPDVVLAAVKACAASWVPEARILGNVRAGDIVRALTRTSQAEAQAPTTAAQASVLTEDERAFIIGLVRHHREAGHYEVANTLEGIKNRLTSTSGAPAPAPIPENVKKAAAFQRARMSALAVDPDEPAPAPTIPTRKKIEVAATRVWEIAKHQAPIEPGTDHERIVRVIEGLFAKGDTPAPTHARQCGYWLDLNCSCGLEGDTP